MSDLYFGDEVTKAVLAFQDEKDINKRNKIFVDKIMVPLQKLINYHYFRMPVARNEEILQDCLVDVYEKIDLYQREKSDRAFPYFNMIVRNFFIQALKRENKQVQNDQFPISLTELKQQQGKLDEYLVEDFDEMLENKEFMEIFKDNLYKWRDQFSKEQEIKTIDALISIFENAEKLELHNKKAAFWYIRELTDLKSKQVATNLNKIKKKFVFLKKKYERGDI